jgi:hypothetical protein
MAAVNNIAAVALMLMQTPARRDVPAEPLKYAQTPGETKGLLKMHTDEPKIPAVPRGLREQRLR